MGYGALETTFEIPGTTWNKAASLFRELGLRVPGTAAVLLTVMESDPRSPRFLERDEAIRREPRPPYAWDGVAEVRPFGAMEKTIVEGVY